MPSASTVAVVVPSPALSEVLEATSLTICAPMFSYGSGSSTSLATVTPSLVTVGEPNFLSSTTLRPLGPSVAVTARDSLETPRRIAWRAASSNNSCFAAIMFCQMFWFQLSVGSADDGEEIIRVHDLVFLAVNFEWQFGSAVFTNEHAVADL